MLSTCRHCFAPTSARQASFRPPTSRRRRGLSTSRRPIPAIPSEGGRTSRRPTRDLDSLRVRISPPCGRNPVCKRGLAYLSVAFGLLYYVCRAQRGTVEALGCPYVCQASSGAARPDASRSPQQCQQRSRPPKGWSEYIAFLIGKARWRALTEN